MIKDYNDFCNELLKAGFSVASGGNDEGIFGLFPYGWNEEPPDSPIRWHTGDPETDPWEWRMRVLNERDDISYSKVFFRKAGYITKEWYPYFLAARRGDRTFEEAYEDGTISHFAKRIYGVVSEHESLPLHGIKELLGVSRDDKSQFDRALTELQMKLYLAICGSQQKMSKKGREYGMASSIFCTTECFWGEEVFEKAAGLIPEQATRQITEQILKLNPMAKEKKIVKFISG